MLTDEQKARADQILADLMSLVRESCNEEIERLRSAIEMHQRHSLQMLIEDPRIRLSEADHELWKVLGCVMIEDDPAFYWEMMFKNLARENARLMERLVKLEDQLRWRKWPEEKPEVKQDTHFQVLYINSKFPGHEILFLFEDGPSFNREDISYWRPIGPLPSEGGE